MTSKKNLRLLPIAQLHDADVGMRWDAANALVACGECAVEPLLELLQSADWSVQHIAIWVLGELRDARAIPVLISALDNSSLHVRLSAARALDKFALPETQGALASWSAMQTR